MKDLPALESSPIARFISSRLFSVTGKPDWYFLLPLRPSRDKVHTRDITRMRNINKSIGAIKKPSISPKRKPVGKPSKRRQQALINSHNQSNQIRIKQVTRPMLQLVIRSVNGKSSGPFFCPIAWREPGRTLSPAIILTKTALVATHMTNPAT